MGITARPSTAFVTAGLLPSGMRAADHVTITNDTVKNNKGSGIDLNGTSYLVAHGNQAYGNDVGINMSDDLVIARNRPGRLWEPLPRSAYSSTSAIYMTLDTLSPSGGSKYPASSFRRLRVQ